MVIFINWINIVIFDKLFYNMYRALEDNYDNAVLNDITKLTTLKEMYEIYVFMIIIIIPKC